MADFKRLLKKYFVVSVAIILLLCTTNINAQKCNSDDDCPVNACCSRFGFCGTGPQFCD